MILVDGGNDVTICLPAVASLDQILGGEEDMVGIRWIDREPAHIKWPLIHQRVPRHKPPVLAAVIGAPQNALFRLNQRINAYPSSSTLSNAQSDPAHIACGQTAAAQAPPVHAAVDRLEDR